MIKVIIAIIILALLSTGATAFQNEPDGFEGLKWGDPIGEDMEYNRMSGPVEYYRRKNDEIYFANCILIERSYGFYEGRLMVVNMFFLTGEHEDIERTVLETIKTKLENDYGKPETSTYLDSAELEDFHWDGARTVIWLRVEWVQDSKNNLGIVRVAFISEAIKDEMIRET